MPQTFIGLGLLLATSAGLTGAALTFGTYALAGALAIGLSVGTSANANLIAGPTK